MVEPVTYVEQVKAMRDIARKAMKENPGAALAFNYPRDVGVIGTASAALEMGLVTANQAGKRVLDAMTASYPASRAPTVNQVRVAWTLAKETP